MDERIKKGKLFHRIKCRNIVDPSGSSLRAEIAEPFNVNLKRRRRLVQYMEKLITKKRIAKQRSVKVAPLHYIPSLSRDNDVQEFCRDCPTTFISRSLEKEILGRVAVRDLQDNYQALLEEIMAENREQFLGITHQSGMGMKLKSEGKSRLEPYRRLGRTENYAAFLKRRQELEGKFLLHHPLIRRILHECVCSLPYELFSLGQWLKGPAEFAEFQDQVQDLANDSSQSLQEFYKKIVALVEHADMANTQGVANYLGACTGLLSVNISRTIAHTLLHVVNFTGSKEHTPYLKLNITFDDKLILQPSADDVVDIYSKFLRRITASARQFYVLEKYKVKGFDNKTVYLCLTDEFFGECVAKIRDNIEAKYEPILRYLEELESDFEPVYQDITSRGDAALTTDLVFEEGCEKILHFRAYLKRVAFIPDNSYFAIGQLHSTEYREKLWATLSAIIGDIFDKLSAQHEWENTDICEAFEIIHIRATQKPITTEEVIEVGKYMAWARDEYLDELQERVVKALEYLAKLIQLGPLTATHMEVNSAAINWLDRIAPIVEENSLVYEQLKFEAEEKLQRVIEEINVEIKQVYPLLTILDSMDDIENVRNYLSSITLHMVRIRQVESQIEWINQEEVSLSFPKSSYSEFEELKNYVYPFYHLLKLCLDVKRNLSVWQDGQFDRINFDRTKAAVEKYQSELSTTQKLYRSKLRQAQDENLSLRFKGTVDDPDVLNWPAPLKLCSKAIKLIQEFKPSLTVIKIMCNGALMRRHWKEMSKVAGFDITPNAGTTLRKIIRIDLESNIDKYRIISAAATKERRLLENLEAMQQEWVGINFTMGKFEGTEILIKLEDIESVADDHIIKVLNMRSSIFVKPYNEDVREFHDTLLKIKETLQECACVQAEILQLLPIFSSQEIAFDIHYEAGLFEEIANIFEKYMGRISLAPSVLETVTNTSISNDLSYCGKILQAINKGVHNYVEKIRQYFPRLYFLSDQEMLRLLSLTKTPEKVQDHLKPIFPAIKSIQIDDNSSVSGVVSDSGEKTNFENAISIGEVKGCVEKWLKSLHQQMVLSTRRNLDASLKNYYETDLIKWLTKWPRQILLTVTQINFTTKGHKSINEGGLEACLGEIVNNLGNLLETARKNELANAVKANLRSLLVVMINHRDVIQSLIERKTETDQDFRWVASLRFYTSENGCFAKILETTIEYGYEYLGDFDQIVVTPSTDRCYHALIAACDQNRHGICEGETGTGKTATFKNLANALAVFCAFFTCSSSLSFQTIVQFLKGVVSCGSWLCLEDSGRIKIEIASLLAQEIFKISSALNTKLGTVLIEDTEVVVNKCFICLTMKMRSKQLPHNLKTLFRSITMTSPDCRIIAEISLVSYGFKQAKTLSTKMVLAHQLFHELSLLKNCDCDMRLMREILEECGRNFHRNKNEEKDRRQIN